MTAWRSRARPARRWQNASECRCISTRRQRRTRHDAISRTSVEASSRGWRQKWRRQAGRRNSGPRHRIRAPGAPGGAPDSGPATPHPRAGATVIGARMPLIAYNINLATDRLDVAKKIAAAVRHSTGGLRFVKTVGVMLGDRGVAQVSMNLTNFEKTPIPRVFEMVKREAERHGVAVLESEIVGLIPQ